MLPKCPSLADVPLSSAALTIDSYEQALRQVQVEQDSVACF